MTIKELKKAIENVEDDTEVLSFEGENIDCVTSITGAFEIKNSFPNGVHYENGFYLRTD